MAETFDVIVIGGGMAGTSVGARLSSDAKVLVLEKESQPGYHATGRSAAAFIPSYGYQIPALNLLTRASLPFFKQAPDGFTELPLLKRRGMLTVVDSNSSLSAETLAAEITAAIGCQIDVLTAAQIHKLVPLMRDTWTSAVYEGDVFDIDVDGLLQGYLRQCRAAPGFKLHCAEAQSIERHVRHWSVHTEDNEFVAPLIVNAAGAWADDVAQKAGVAPLNLTPLRRTAALIKLPEGNDVDTWPLVFAADGSFYLKPDAGLLLASPADEHLSPPCDAQPEELDVAFAAHYAEQALEMTVERVSSSWAGLRTFAADRAPVVGFDPEQPGFFWLAGQGGHGIQIAPALAELAASLILEKRVPASLEALGFEREWVCPGRLSDALQKTVSTDPHLLDRQTASSG
jgi:D-arginine dehydrogenase